MRQLLYVSSSSQPVGGAELANILRVSRRNNERDGLTGLLWTDGARFLQVLEGEAERIDATLAKSVATIATARSSSCTIVLSISLHSDAGRWLFIATPMRTSFPRSRLRAQSSGVLFEGFINARRAAA